MPPVMLYKYQVFMEAVLQPLCDLVAKLPQFYCCRDFVAIKSLMHVYSGSHRENISKISGRLATIFLASVLVPSCHLLSIYVASFSTTAHSLPAFASEPDTMKYRHSFIYISEFWDTTSIDCHLRELFL